MNNTPDLGFVHRYEPPRQPGARTLLLLHGTGGNEDDLLDLGRMLDSGAGLLSPRGKVLERGMPRFFRRFAEGVFDTEDVIFRAGELAEFVRKAVQVYGFDSGSVMAVGYSNGANVAAALLLLHPQTLAGGVLLRSMVPLTPETLPDLTGKRIYMSSGQHDPIVPPDNAKTLAQLFQSAGADTTLVWHNRGHDLSREEVEEAAVWLRSHKNLSG